MGASTFVPVSFLSSNQFTFMNYIAFVIPAFFLFLGLEYLAARKRKKQAYFTYENTLSNISVGLAERLLNISVSVLFYACFDYISCPLCIDRPA